MTKITHITHPSGPLTREENPTKFRCDGCGFESYDISYSCSCRCRCRHDCRCRCRGGFDLHGYCATGPRFFIYCGHRLTQTVVSPDRNRCCDICQRETFKLVYLCNDCPFVIHPLCLEDQIRDPPPPPCQPCVLLPPPFQPFVLLPPALRWG